MVRPAVLINGLPQGSVLAPTLFNLYMSDFPQIQGSFYQYADDIAILTQAPSIQEAEDILNEDLEVVENYLIKWRLTPNPQKSIVTAFHLSNRDANHPIQAKFAGSILSHDPHPKYLGVTLDRTLTYKPHLVKLGSKIRTRTNII